MVGAPMAGGREGALCIYRFWLVAEWRNRGGWWSCWLASGGWKEQIMVGAPVAGGEGAVGESRGWWTRLWLLAEKEQ